ncbi:hypothetical protein HY224_01745 [Candidatus Uhrbacteria bacterium]|nr:hypothetical protein [Candidatus Uhrbacteria bacterium]
MIIVWLIWLLKIFLVLLLTTFAYAGLKAAPWVPARTVDLDRIKRLIDLKAGQKMVDIGAGNAKVLIKIAESAPPGAQCLGYEISLLPYLLARIKLAFHNPQNIVKLKYSDFTKQSLKEFDVVYCFLMPKFLEKFKTKLQSELKPGAKFISYVFSVPGWPPTYMDKPNPKDLPIYVYIR